MKNPPSGVKLVMAAVCVMKDIRPDKINDPSGKTKKVNKFIGQSNLVTYSFTLLTTYLVSLSTGRGLLGSQQEITR